MDSYQSIIEWLYSQLPMFQSIGAGAYKPGLQTAWLLAESFGNPHEKFKAIHVGGTNGKGSTSHSLAAVLQKQGYKVGLYTSPHLFDFRERIRINGEMIPQQDVVDFVHKYREMGLDCQPSFFELTTIMAFDYFAREKVDYAIIEVGLGGRLDTTNIITPILSIITNISLDHTALLGDTEEAIAAEKAGIIKPGVPIVVSESAGAVRNVFLDRAVECKSEIVFADDEPLHYRLVDGRYEYAVRIGDETISVISDLQGDCQTKNMAAIVAAIRKLKESGVNISAQSIVEGLSHVQEITHLLGRWMTLRASNPQIVCDTGHNEGAWRWLAPRLCQIANERHLRVVLGFANDKDVESIFPKLPKNATYYFVEPQVKRARSANDLLALAQQNGLRARAFASVQSGITQALTDANAAISSSDNTKKASDFIFIGGSNFVVAEIPISIMS